MLLAIGTDATAAVRDPAPAAHDPGRPFRALFVGRFYGWKDMHLRLPAFAHLLKRHPHARLTWVVGNLPDPMYHQGETADGTELAQFREDLFINFTWHGREQRHYRSAWRKG